MYFFFFAICKGLKLSRQKTNDIWHIITSESGRLKKFWPIFSPLSNRTNNNLRAKLLFHALQGLSCFITSSFPQLQYIYTCYCIVWTHISSVFPLKTFRFRIILLEKIYTIHLYQYLLRIILIKIFKKNK